MHWRLHRSSADQRRRCAPNLNWIAAPGIEANRRSPVTLLERVLEIIGAKPLPDLATEPCARCGAASDEHPASSCSIIRRCEPARADGGFGRCAPGRSAGGAW
jgi:hypothetical protein